MEQGKVWLVGAGPGDGRLLTLGGREALERADVVVYDALVGPAVLAMIPPDARRIHVGKRASRHTVPQEEINRILLEEAQAGNRVVRLKGGDPFLFGRGGEELELLREHGIPFEIVPGVTSAIAVPAYNGIPVTHRDFTSSLHIVTGHTKKSPGAQIDYAALVRLQGTLVFLMGVTAMEGICRGLLAAGIDPETPAAVLERGTTARQRRVVSTVERLPEEAQKARIGTPSIIVVGKVCALAEQFHWAENRPLGRSRIVVTRPRERASALSQRLREMGAEVVELPSIRTVEIMDNPALAEALAQIHHYGWLVFTSPAGVASFFSQLRRQRFDLRRLAGLKLAAIGSATRRELEQRGLLVDLVPREYSGAALGEALARTAAGERVLLLRARIGSPDVTAALEKAGVPYEDLPLYDTEYESPDADQVREQLQQGEIDFVAFTSASTVRGFVRTIGETFDYSGLRAACIGAQTAAAANEYGMKISTAEEATMDGMVRLMARLAAEKGE